MEIYPTSFTIEFPNEMKNEKQLFNEFLNKYPKCSKQFELPLNLKQKCKYFSAFIIANIVDNVINWQQFQKLYECLDILQKIVRNKQCDIEIQNFIQNVILAFNKLFQNIQPFDYNQKWNSIHNQQQQIIILNKYFEEQRKHLFSLLENEEGIDVLFKISRGIALRFCFMADYEQTTQFRLFQQQGLNKEQIIKYLINDNYFHQVNNMLILEDCELLPIADQLNIPFVFFFNKWDKERKYLEQKIIDQQQNEYKQLTFFREIDQEIESVRILHSIPNIIFLQNIINQQQNYGIQSINQTIILQFSSIIQNLINQLTNDFTQINQFWISKIIEIIKNKDTQTLYANTLNIKLNENVKQDSYQLFKMFNFNHDQLTEFLNSQESQLYQTEQLIENIIISQVSLIRDSLNDMVNQNQYKTVQEQNKIDQNYQNVNQIISVISNEFSKISLQNDKQLNIDYQNSNEIQNYSLQKPLQTYIQCQDYNQENDEQESQSKQQTIINNQINNESKINPIQTIQKQQFNNLTRTSKYQNNNKQNKEIKSQIIISKQQFHSEIFQKQKQRRKSEEQIDLEITFKLQNDYLQNCQIRDSIRKTQNSNQNSQININKEQQKLQFTAQNNIKTQKNNQNRLLNSQIILSNNSEEYKKCQEMLTNSFISESNIKIQNKTNLITFNCPICYKIIFNKEEIKQLHDEHKLCKQCLSTWIKVKFNSGQWNFKFFECPIQLFKKQIIQSCKHIIDLNEVKKILTFEEFRILTEGTIKHYIIDIQCPNQNCKINIKGMNPSQIEANLFCPQCNYKICWICKNSDHDGQKCPQRLEEIKQALQDERISCCPNCLEIYMKNEGCEHVTCVNCLTEFCFACSALRIPLISHGSHYHRVGCQYRKPWINQETNQEILDEEFDPINCFYCRESKIPCKRPVCLEDFKKLVQIIN